MHHGTAAALTSHSASPQGCSVADWECVRGTAYMYRDAPLTDAQAAADAAQGFEVGVHVNTICANNTPTELENFYTAQISQFNTSFPSMACIPAQPLHCLE